MRLDKPTLQCDRCKFITDDLTVMFSFSRLSHSHMSGTEEWDLCPTCWNDFQDDFLSGK